MKFETSHALNVNDLINTFGVDEDDIVNVFEANGEGVYLIRSGSRGYIDEITFQGKGPEFEYTDYVEIEEELFYQEADEDEEFDPEFQFCEWEDQAFVCAQNEEESDVYVYFAPSIKEAQTETIV
jgi:hypothetical protein